MRVGGAGPKRMPRVLALFKEGVPIKEIVRRTGARGRSCATWPAAAAPNVPPASEFARALPQAPRQRVDRRLPHRRRTLATPAGGRLSGIAPGRHRMGNPAAPGPSDNGSAALPRCTRTRPYADHRARPALAGGLDDRCSRRTLRPALVMARDIIDSFHRLLRSGDAVGLAPWLEAAAGSPISSFANGVATDRAAVTGPVPAAARARP